MKSLARWFMVALLVTTLGMFGCTDDGSDGAAGADGLSAYDAAVAQGYVDPALVTEAEFYEGLATAAAEASLPLARPAEACNVCHGEDDELGIPAQHEVVQIEKPVVSAIQINRSAGDALSIDFHVEAGGDPLADLTLSDVRAYIADIVPAGTVTAQGTWPTAFLERWVYERDRTSAAGTSLDVTDAANGNYTLNLVSTPADLLTGNAAVQAVYSSASEGAPDGDLATHVQRLLLRVDARDYDFNRTIGLVDFMMPAAGASTTGLATLARELVPMEACTACHGDPLQEAAHGGGYQSPQACAICHSPIGEYGDDMQISGFWLPSLIHTIHNAGAFTGAWPDEDPADFSEVTYPQDIRECSVCHDDAVSTSWKDNPSIEVCSTCHDVTFGASATHSGGTQVNDDCAVCHPASGNGFGQSVAGAHTVTYDAETQVYNVTISLSPDANADGVYEVGETILVTATTDLAGFNYTNTDTSVLRSANLYVYGPRAKAVPVLTPGSTTDADYVAVVADDPTVPPDQGRSMLISAAADDAQVMTDASGFKYQLLEVTADMAAGTYMIQTNIDYSLTGDRTTDGRHIGPRFYPLDGWQLKTFQVKTATEETKIAGGCENCHDQRNFSTMAHRGYFGSDGCVACHDQSGNHADPLTNRVHAVHAASTAGDLTNVPGQTPSRVWDEIAFPRDLNISCDACHEGGPDSSYATEPKGSFAFACIGCHGDTTGAREHMEQNGAPFPTH